MSLQKVVEEQLVKYTDPRIQFTGVSPDWIAREMLRVMSEEGFFFIHKNALLMNRDGYLVFDTAPKATSRYDNLLMLEDVLISEMDHELNYLKDEQTEQQVEKDLAESIEEHGGVL